MKKVLIFSKTEVPNYIRGCELVGLDYVVSCEVKNLDGYDGLILVGSTSSTDPSLYGASIINCTEIDRDFDLACIEVIKHFISKNKPILGICKGIQIINVALGGTLNQNIKNHKKSGLVNAHKVYKVSDNLLSEFYGDEFYVNSTHMQCVDKVAPTLHVTFVSKSGSVEAVEHENGKVIGVQWHPEKLLGVKYKTMKGLGVFKAYKKLFN